MCRGGGTSEAESEDASAAEETSSVVEESAAAKAAPVLRVANGATQITDSSSFADMANGGTYQLANNITVSSTVFVSKAASLDLNGHTINSLLDLD